jgi:hypothetical protein
MKTFKVICIIMMVITFLATISGAYHQFIFLLISGICYAVIDSEIKKEQKTNKPYSRTFNADNL